MINIKIAYDCALLSQMAYNNDPDRIRSLCIMLGFTNIEIMKVENTEWIMATKGDIVYIAFRGTDSIKDFLNNARSRKKKIKIIGHVHNGFYQATTKAIHKTISYLQQHHGKKVYFTGHSLGGAIATIMFAYLSNMMKFDLNSFCCTFGAPRVFSRKASMALSKTYNDRLYRFVYDLDIVPRLPLRLMNYRHFGNLYFIDKKKFLWKNISQIRKIEIIVNSLDRFEMITGGLLSVFGRMFFSSMQDHSIDNYVEYVSRYLE